MPRTGTFNPDWASAPGETVSDVLRERGISVEEFAARTGQTAEEVIEFLLGRSQITIGLARRLRDALGGSIEFWMSRDFEYQKKIEDSTVVDGSWLRDLPLADMARFGWLRSNPKPSQMLAACLDFFGVPNIATWHRVYGRLEQKFLFRNSQVFESRPASVAAWLRQGELQGQAIPCQPWNAKAFESALTSARALTREKDPQQFVPALQRLCAEAGVAVVTVRAPDGCRASGATRFVSPDKALLLLSFRFLSDDQFWFSVFHEAGHLLLHSRNELYLEGLEAVDSSAEIEANEFAARILIPDVTCSPEFSPSRM